LCCEEKIDRSLLLGQFLRGIKLRIEEKRTWAAKINLRKRTGGCLLSAHGIRLEGRKSFSVGEPSKKKKSGSIKGERHLDGKENRLDPRLGRENPLGVSNTKSQGGSL